MRREARTLHDTGYRADRLWPFITSTSRRGYPASTRIAMRPTQEEFANPREWLIRLAEASDGYRQLVSDSRGFGRAAYRLARARCQATNAGEPCLDDLQAAATLLANCLGSGGALPIQSLLPSSRPPPAPSQQRSLTSSRPRSNRAHA